MKTIWIGIAFLAGALLPLQGAINAKLGKTLDSTVGASLISFVAGTIAIVIYSLITRQHLSWTALKTISPYMLLGGIFGAFYITVTILAFPKIGPALTFGLIVAGQMIISVILDHFNLLVLQQHSINIWRILGVVLIIAGVLLIRKF
jgi:transporter family-2 protein